MIQFEHIYKSYGNTPVLKDIHFQIQEGEFFVFVGLSGSGKTTSLKMINKLIVPDKGKLTINGKDIQALDERDLRMDIGYVLQQASLFPNLSVEENISIIAKLKKWDKEKIRTAIHQILPLVGLDPSYLTKMPNELSGGEAQRVGIIRAILTHPKILLMDEPFSALDPLIRKDLQNLIDQLHHELGITFVFVTHDMREAFTLADRIAVFHHGEILQLDIPEKIKNHPAHPFVERLFESEDLK